MSSTSLKASPSGNFADTNALANITILGVQNSPLAVQLNGQDVGSLCAHDAGFQKLHISGLDELTQDGAWAQGWTLTWS